MSTLTGTALTTTTAGVSQTDINAIQTDTTKNTYTAASGGNGDYGSVSINLKADGTVAGASDTTAFTSVDVKGDGNGGYTYTAKSADGNTTLALTTTQAGALFSTTGGALAGKGALASNTNAAASADGIAQANAQNVPPKVSDIDLTKANGANLAIESIDNALDSVNSIQADLGAAQNRFSSIASTQTAQSTNLSSAQSQITDANFAQETANLSKAQVLQQAGISVLAQANSMPQQVLKLLG
ncbi:flagellin [Caballeronia sp. LZ035]|uniref:flagellin n=1 Tax=Caballeronia sp. LZ035 TaxID=3038568 RepID=UPI0038D3B880